MIKKKPFLIIGRVKWAWIMHFQRFKIQNQATFKSLAIKSNLQIKSSADWYKVVVEDRQKTHFRIDIHNIKIIMYKITMTKILMSQRLDILVQYWVTYKHQAHVFMQPMIFVQLERRIKCYEDKDDLHITLPLH